MTRKAAPLAMLYRALQEWGLIRRVHRMGDRKDYFVGETEVWAIFETSSTGIMLCVKQTSSTCQ